MEAAQFAIWPVVAVVNAEGTKVGGNAAPSIRSVCAWWGERESGSCHLSSSRVSSRTAEGLGAALSVCAVSWLPHAVYSADNRFRGYLTSDAASLESR